MEGVNNDFLGKHKKFRVDSKKLATVFFVAAFIVAIVVFWWLKLVGITVTGEAFCGLEEHIHGEACYISEIICDIDEAETDTPAGESATDETTTEIPEEVTDDVSGNESVTEITTDATTTKKAHTHTSECLRETLICKKTEHTHTEECFPDKNADVETVSDWLNTIDGVKITNDIPENLIAIAMTQVGYEESIVNFEYDSEGNRNGYTRYGEWYGNHYGKWNTMFVSFCLHYSNINNDSELKKAGAESLRLAWENRYAYSSAEEYAPERGDIVFFDNDKDGVSDAVAIIIAPGETEHVVVMGDSNGKVETKSIDASEGIMGYGLTGKLSFAKDMEHELNKEDTETTDPIHDPEETINQRVPLMMMSAAPVDEDHTIRYINDLTEAVTGVYFKTEDGVEIPENGTVYIGQNYIVSLTFSETNTGKEWIQFQHGDDHRLVYPIPENLKCAPFDEPHPITAKTENGTIEKVGEYFVDENGMLYVEFIDYEDGLCFGQKYSNVEFTIDFNVTIGANQSGTSTDIVFNDKINVELNVDGGAGMTVDKTHGEYDEDNHTMDYTIKVEATHGLVKDFTFEDYTWNTHKILRDTIVVTDLNGVPLNPQPTVGDSFVTNVYSGFSLVGFPDFAAGEGYLITYKTKVDDNYISNDTVALSNGAYGAGKDSKGTSFGSYDEDYVVVEPEKIAKDGKQTVLKDANGNDVPVIEWEVVIKKDNHNLKGTVIIDTLGEGLQYYTDQPILIKHYDEWGNPLADQYLSWDNVTINGNSMNFPLPDGYMFDIIYYTTYEDLNEGEQKQYNNSVSATINGKYETAGGEADVVGFVPRVNKNAYGNDGEYVYFTIETDVPAAIKDWGNFYLTDTAAFWGYSGNAEGYLYVENLPENIEITAVTESGRTITFTPYVPGGPIENTYILVSPLNDMQHTFRIYFNTSQANNESSKWLLDENAVLTVTYKVPFEVKTGTEWSGELSGDKTLEDVLLENHSLANQATVNYSNVIKTDHTANYKYSPKISKNSVVNKDGTIDYTVVFYNTVPGSNGNAGYLASSDIAYFTDTFDEKLEYVPGSLTVYCYDPWNANNWLNRYRYNGTVSGNSMEIASTEFTFDKWNPECGWGEEWLSGLSNYQIYCKNMGGGNHVFTYKLKLKDEYLYSTEVNKYELDNTAELKWDEDNTSGPVTDKAEFETGLIDKQVAQDGNNLDFSIVINEDALDILEGMDTLTITDTMTPNLSVYWNTIKLYYKETANGPWISFDDAASSYDYSVKYDQDSNKLTFIIPDELRIKVDYSTLITGNGFVSVENTVSIDGKAQLTDIVDATFHVQDHSGGATGFDYSVTMLKQDGDTNVRLPDVKFHLYGLQGDPHAVLPEGAQQSIYDDNGQKLNYIGTYITGPDGTTEIRTQFLTVGGPYALVEATPPAGYMPLQKPVYFYFYDPDPNGIIQTVTTLIAVENYTYGFVLPETGGTGTLPLAIIGFAMTAFPILYSTIRRKRERRST